MFGRSPISTILMINMPLVMMGSTNFVVYEEEIDISHVSNFPYARRFLQRMHSSA